MAEEQRIPDQHGLSRRRRSVAHLLKTCLALIVGTFGVCAGTAVAQFQEWTAEPLSTVQIKTVAYKGWVPARPEPLRGTLVLIPGRHGDGRGMAADPKWQELATATGFAVIGCQFADGDPFLYQNDPKGEVSRAISAAVIHLAQATKHLELEKAPLALWGTSAGSGVASNYASSFPVRVAAFASSKGTCGPNPELPPGKDEIPMLFALGAKDKAEWIAESEKNIEAGLKKRAPWTLALHKSEGHEVGRSLDLARLFLKATIEQRLQAPTAASSAPSIFKTTPRPIGNGGIKAAVLVKLAKIDPRNGWLGDPDTYEVAPAATFKGSKAKATWLPDEATAKAWQEYLRK